MVRHIKLLLWRPTLCGDGDDGWLQMHPSGSPTPHNSYQRLWLMEVTYGRIGKLSPMAVRIGLPVISPKQPWSAL